MIHLVTAEHRKHFETVGIAEPVRALLADDKAYQHHYRNWQKTYAVMKVDAPHDLLHMKTLANLGWLQHRPQAAPPAPDHSESLLKVAVSLLAVIAFLLLMSQFSYGQFSQIDTVTITDGTTIFNTAGPFKMSFAGCAVTKSGSTATITCSGSAANPGGSPDQVQYNSGGTGFAGIAFGINGQVLESCGSNCIPQFQDPIVSGPDAPGVASTKNPVQMAGNDGTDVRAISTDSSGRLNINVNGTVPVSGTFWQATQPVSGTFWQATQPVSIASMPSTPVTGTFWQSTQPVSIADGSAVTLGSKADAKSTATDSTAITIMQVLKEISAMAQAPASTPVTGTFWQTTQPVSAASLPLPSGAATAAKQPALGTAGSASADVITIQGIASMTPVKVDGSGVTQPVSGTVTVTQATGTNLHTVCDSGCSSSAGFADNSAFTVGTTAINPIGGLYDTGADPTITNGSAARARIDSHSYLLVDGSQVTQPVSGTFWQTTQPVSAASLPLPTGAAQDSSLTTLDTDVKSNVTLHAGTNLIGKAGFDSTTPGTTDAVSMLQPSRTTGTVTTSSSTVPVSTVGYSVATVTVNGTYAGITANFEFSDDGGTTYYSDTCTRTDTNVQESSEALPSNQTRAWDCGVFAATNFRVRSSAYTSGTANIGITLSAASIEPAPTVSVSGTVPVSGTVNTTPPSNASTNLAQVNGASTSATNPLYIREADGTNAVTLDPCRVNANTFKPISQTANTQLVTGTASKKIYICSINLVTAGANNVAMVEGTGTTCATSTAGMAGGATAATGWNFAANGGLTQGNGMGSIMAEATAADNLCLFQSAAVQVSGVIGYVVQ